MNYRQITVDDFRELHSIRMAVKENILSDPKLITEIDYKEMIEQKGRGWLCETEDGIILGFSIIDLSRANVWALFVHPDHERKGIGKELFRIIIDWGFENRLNRIWLGTDPGTRAFKFYKKAGMTEIGMQPNGEMYFEIAKKTWLKHS